jgi:hypothetical protein
VYYIVVFTYLHLVGRECFNVPGIDDYKEYEEMREASV